MTDGPSFPETFGAVTSLTLINLAKSADPTAWETLFRLYSPLVRYWVRKSRIPQLDEDDLVQEVFRSIHAGLARFEKKSETDSFRAWIRTITQNKIRDYLRTQANKPLATGGTTALRLVHQAPDHELAVELPEMSEDRLVIHEALEIVRREIQSQTFQAFWRSTVDGIAPSLVAEELGIPLHSVYQAKSRVLRRLRDLLE
jgi:RNA polymerase sigma-70 factor (ECF subfamily)